MPSPGEVVTSAREAGESGGSPRSSGCPVSCLPEDVGFSNEASQANGDKLVRLG